MKNLQNSNCKKSPKLKLWKKTQNANCDETQKLKLEPNLTTKKFFVITTQHLDYRWDVFEAAFCDLAMFSIYFMILVLLSAHFKIFSVSRLRDLSQTNHWHISVCLNIGINSLISLYVKCTRSSLLECLNIFQLEYLPLFPGDLLRPDHDPDHPPPASLPWGAAHRRAHRCLWNPPAVWRVHLENILSAGNENYQVGLQCFNIINHLVKSEVTYVCMLVCPRELAVEAL